MRPVDKGAAPFDFAEYEEAGPALRARLGEYCSYCERQIETNLAVEHVQPKSVVPALILDWDNFLLACTNCNSTKGDTPIQRGDYFWPDVDNTLRAFEYIRGGLIQPHSCLQPEMAVKAATTLSLTGLDRYPGNSGREPTRSDRRWLRRQEAWQKAEWCRAILTGQDTVTTREMIVEIALSRGEFSIWWTAFAGDIDMRRRFRLAFAGTHGGSFDRDENTVARNGGQL